MSHNGYQQSYNKLFFSDINTKASWRVGTQTYMEIGK